MHLPPTKHTFCTHMLFSSPGFPDVATPVQMSGADARSRHQMRFVPLRLTLVNCQCSLYQCNVSSLGHFTGVIKSM